MRARARARALKSGDTNAIKNDTITRGLFSRENECEIANANEFCAALARCRSLPRVSSVARNRIIEKHQDPTDITDRKEVGRNWKKIICKILTLNLRGKEERFIRLCNLRGEFNTQYFQDREILRKEMDLNFIYKSDYR